MSLMDSYCVKCSLQFDKKIIFNMHMSIVHKEMVEIKEEPIDTVENEPEENIINQSFSCEICEKKFSQMKTLKKHVSSVHETETFQCEICNIIFSKEAILKRHVSSVHENKLFECEICDKTFSTKGNFKKTFLISS